MACIHERFVHRGEIVGIRIQTGANAVDAAERATELARSRKKASAVEEIDQPPSAGTDERLAHTRGDDCAGIEQELGTCLAREVLLPERVAAVAEGTGSHPEQPAVVLIRPPRQQRRVFGQELPQTFDVIVMDAASGLGYGPLESPAQTLLDLLDEVLPAWKPVFARQHQLGIAP